MPERTTADSGLTPITETMLGEAASPGTRREFLRLLGAGSAALLVPAALAACGRDGSDPMSPSEMDDALAQVNDDPSLPAATLDFSSDIGILNYAYGLEQLEARFYILVVAGATALTAEERDILRDVRDHEIAHRDFLKAALGPNAIPDLTFDFSAVDLASRQSVLKTAQVFEDTGVGAYNGAGPRLRNAEYLVVAGKIVSVEARHAAAIRKLLLPGFERFFAGNDVVNSQGLDVAYDPRFVLGRVDPFIRNPITVVGL